MPNAIGIQCPDSGQVVRVSYVAGRLRVAPDLEDEALGAAGVLEATSEWCERLNGQRCSSMRGAEDLLVANGVERDDLDAWYW